MERTMIVNAHKPQLDEMTPAEIRVICEQLLYTMDIEQRIKFLETYPGLYAKIEPPKDSSLVSDQPDTGK